MSGPSLGALVERLPAVRVLCVGDVMLDRFVYGEVSRISPEAPIPVMRAVRTRTVLGGAGNVLRNLVALGCEVAFVAALGDDAEGAELHALAHGLPGVETRLLVDAARSTSVKSRFVAGGQQMLRVDAESDEPLPGALAEQVLAAAREFVAGCDVVVLSDYGKGVLGAEVIAALIDIARDAGRCVFVDPKGLDYGVYRGAHAITPNLRELADASRTRLVDDAAVVGAAREIIENCGVATMLVTRSERGMSLVDAGGGVTHLPAEAREVFDVSGAGDTVIAVTAAAFAACGEMREAAALANVAAGAVVGKLGTAVLDRAELADALRIRNLTAAEAKVLAPQAARERVERWQRDGLAVGFTNGCFDLLHPGHVSLLEQAARACDRLVVGLNSDESVRRLKGARRPVQNEAARSAVVASLQGVDAVVIFGDDTPMALLASLRPDVLVKGADYARNEVVGGDLVEGYGGRVLLAKLLDGFSTTSTISRLEGG